LQACTSHLAPRSSPHPEKKKIAWAVGEKDSTTYGMILFSNDGGDSWIRQGEGSEALKDIDIYDVWAVDENTAWAVGTDNAILKTINGGQNWTRENGPKNPGQIYLYSISIVEKTNIWVSGAPGIVYNSTNNGESWTVYDAAFFQNGLMQGIWAINPQVVYVVGGLFNKGGASGFIGRTLNGGKNWETVDLPDNYNKNEWIGVKATDQDNIVVYGCQAHYSHSTDGGTNWQNNSIEVGGGCGAADINCLKMLDKQSWWGAFDLENILITNNTGSTWNNQQSVDTGNMFLVGIDAYDENLALITGQTTGYIKEGKIIKTSNGGDLWELKYFCKSSLYKVSFIKD